MLTATLNIRIMKTKALLCLLTLMLVLAGADAEAQRKKKKNKGGKEKNEKEQFELMTKFVDASKEKMLGNFEEAEALYNECIKIDSKNAASYYELANLKLMQKSNDEALVLANKALDIDPTNEWYTLFLADLHNVRYEYNLSEELFDRLIEAHPGKVEYIYELGSVQLFQNKLKEAVKTYNKIELALGVTEEISIQKQKLYLEMNDLDGAIKEVQGLIDNYPREVRYLGILAEMYNVNGMSQEALRVYEKMSDKDPNDPRVQLSMAEHYKSLGKYDESYEYLKDAFSNSKLGIDPKIKVLLSYFEISETELKLKTQAYELLDILTDQHSEDPKAHAMKADFLYRDRRLEEAQKSFIKTVELDSSRFMVWSQLTQVDYELGDNEALLRDSETASELFPNQSIFYLFRGLAFNEAKRTDEAVEVLEAGKAFANRQPEVKVQMLSILGNVYND
ncbi:MAG: tetratricopeptide (TPR) repeat protein, partial [Flavobacteriales bacterium]